MQTIRTNLKNNASLPYTNHPHTTMCIFEGMVIGAGPTGVFQLCCGADDDGVEIDAYFITPTINLGVNGSKRNDFAYADIEGGDIQLSLTGDGKTTIGPYLIETLDDETAQRRRVKMGSGLSWHYASVKVENVNGSSVSLAGLDMLINFPKNRNY